MVTAFDGTRSQVLGDLTIEHGVDEIAIFGSLSITRDRAGLEFAKSLRQVLNEAVMEMESDTSLPLAISLKKTDEIDNPFLAP